VEPIGPGPFPGKKEYDEPNPQVPGKEGTKKMGKNVNQPKMCVHPKRERS